MKVFLFICEDDKAQREVLVSQALRTYASLQGLCLPDFALLQNEDGKPYLSPPCGIEFSISHSEGTWVCAVSDAPVGVDLQFEKQLNNEGIARRFFHPDEYAALQKSGFSDFFRIWCAKESYVKLLGCGINDDFGKFSIYALNNISFTYLSCIEHHTLCLACFERPEIEVVNNWCK